MIRLLLITASAPDTREVRRSRVLGFQQVTMPYLAAFVPDDWEVTHVDEAIEPVDTSAPVDLVAITFHTPSAPHAYHLAERFRARGVTVAMGGPHATLLPDEAQAHADVVFVGEAEETWPQFLADFERRAHVSRYECASPPSLAQVPLPRRDLFHRRDGAGGVLFASRGCPHGCDFCTVAVMYGSRPRTRRVADVSREYASCRGKIAILWDDNIAADPAFAKELFDEIAPHRKWWSCQASVEAAFDDEFLSKAAHSGCKQLFVGLESVCQSSLDGVSKAFNHVNHYREAIARIHGHGIAVQAGIVFGFDGDTPDVFDRTVDLLEETGVENATFNMLTPFPGTRIFERLAAEGRILTRDWSRYNGRADVVFEPLGMTADELQAGFERSSARFYSARSIARRLSRSPSQLAWTLPLNLAYAAALRRAGGAGVRRGGV